MNYASAIHVENIGVLSVETEIKVNTYDIDIADHVNNIVYLRWLEDLRNLLFSRMCPLDKILELNYYPVVAHTEMKYKKQITLFDKPIGKMIVEKYSHGVIVLRAEIRVNNCSVFSATQKCVLMNLTTKKMYKRRIDELFK
ncbi:MAG: thioesterase family protein [Melioribacteraceae bacterium]